MQCRDIASGMIKQAYDLYKNGWVEDVATYNLSEELNRYDILVWNDMSNNTKRAAIEYVYKNVDTIELNSNCVESWVQATAYFMLMTFAKLMCPQASEYDIELEMFFDDLDFMMEYDTLTDRDVQKQLGISKDFTNNF